MNEQRKVEVVNNTAHNIQLKFDSGGALLRIRWSERKPPSNKRSFLDWLKDPLPRGTWLDCLIIR